MATMIVSELASYVGGSLLGDGGLEVHGVCALYECETGLIAPILHPRNIQGLKKWPHAVIAREELAMVAIGAGVDGAVVVSDPLLALQKIIELFHPGAAATGERHATAVIDGSAQLDPSVSVGPRAIIESGVQIGSGSNIGPGAIICRDTCLGKNVVIGPHAVIGAEGFGFIPTKGAPLKIRHIGRVVLEDGVEVGACTCIDRGTLGATRVGAQTKIDNLVQIGHNVQIGRNVLIAGQVGIAGSTVVEDNVMLGGKVGIADHLTIGVAARVAAGSGVISDVAPNAEVAGYPALPRRKWLRAMATLFKMGNGKSLEDK